MVSKLLLLLAQSFLIKCVGPHERKRSVNEGKQNDLKAFLFLVVVLCLCLLKFQVQISKIKLTHW